MRHIVHLKALESYSAHIRSHYFSDGTSAGVLFVYPTSVTTYESMKYPQTRYVVLSSSDSPSVTQQLLVHFPTDGSFILKLTNGEDKAVVERKFALNRITSFLSYTNPARVTFARSGMVRTSAKLDERLLPLFRQNGYEREEVVGYFNLFGSNSPPLAAFVRLEG